MAELFLVNKFPYEYNFWGIFFKRKQFLIFIKSYKNPELCKMVNYGLADTLVFISN